MGEIMEHSKTKILTGLALSVGLIAGTATMAAASPTEVMGSGPEAGGVSISDTGAQASGETTGVSTRNDGGGGSFWQWG